LTFDAGISTVSWAAWMAFRTLGRESGMGSVIDIGLTP